MGIYIGFPIHHHVHLTSWNRGEMAPTSLTETFMDCTLEKNRANCPCTADCDKKGACCQCVAHHRGKNQLPACFFPPEAEKTFDRSFTHFARLVNEGLAS